MRTGPITPFRLKVGQDGILAVHDGISTAEVCFLGFYEAPAHFVRPIILPASKSHQLCIDKKVIRQKDHAVV